MPEQTYLNWPFLEDRHRELAVEFRCWADREIAPLSEKEPKDDAGLDDLARELVAREVERVNRAVALELVEEHRHLDVVEVRVRHLERLDAAHAAAEEARERVRRVAVEVEAEQVVVEAFRKEVQRKRRRRRRQRLRQGEEDGEGGSDEDSDSEPVSTLAPSLTTITPTPLS